MSFFRWATAVAFLSVSAFAEMESRTVAFAAGVHFDDGITHCEHDSAFGNDVFAEVTIDGTTISRIALKTGPSSLPMSLTELTDAERAGWVAVRDSRNSVWFQSVSIPARVLPTWFHWWAQFACGAVPKLATVGTQALAANFPMEGLLKPRPPISIGGSWLGFEGQTVQGRPYKASVRLAVQPWELGM